jgi:acyl-CoA synthetase (AMP-forming)/AMP-acid ligase II
VERTANQDPANRPRPVIQSQSHASSPDAHPLSLPGPRSYPRKTGGVSGASRFTYAQFERCERLAAGLLSAGVQPGDRVAYLSFNNHQLLEGYFGVLLAGAVVMPLNVRLTA